MFAFGVAPDALYNFFPTPFLWPLSNFHVDGIPWSNPWIWFPNLALLAVAYGIWWYMRRWKAQKDKTV